MSALLPFGIYVFSTSAANVFTTTDGFRVKYSGVWRLTTIKSDQIVYISYMRRGRFLSFAGASVAALEKFSACWPAKRNENS